MVTGLARYSERFVESLRDELEDAIELLRQKDKEVEVLTLERDNALLRIEELERWLETLPVPDTRGGVNPNA